jgi:hypothetical protein
MATGTLAHADAAARAAFAQQCGAEAHAVRAMLLAMARGLRFGGAARFLAPKVVLARVPGSALALHLAPELQGPYWLGERMIEQVDRLRALLLETEPNWNIERHGAHALLTPTPR